MAKIRMYRGTIKSLKTLFKRTEEEQAITQQWQLTTIKSINKKRNQEKESGKVKRIFHGKDSVKSA